MNEIDWLQLANQLSVCNTLQTSIVPEGDKGHDLTCFHYLQFQSLFESSKTRSRQYPEPIGYLTVTCTSCLSPINSGQLVINKIGRQMGTECTPIFQ